MILSSISGSVMGGILWAIAHHGWRWAVVFLGRVGDECGCAASLPPLPLPSLTALGLMIVLSGAFIAYCLYQFVHVVVQTQRYSSRTLASARSVVSSRLRHIIKNLDMPIDRVVEIRANAPTVFCFGLIRPRICISDGLVKLLNDGELKAVLLHEWHHLSNFDPLKFFALKYIQNALFFVPGLSALIHQHMTLAELAADERATHNFAQKHPLAWAMYKVTASEERRVMRSGLALSFFSSITAERINRLADDAYYPRTSLLDKGFYLRLIGSTLALLLLGMVLARPTPALGGGGGSCRVLPQDQERFQSACMISTHAPICSAQYRVADTSCPVVRERVWIK